MSAEPKYVAATLAWCNRLRALDGKRPLDKLPKGIREEPSSCPCGRATGWDVVGPTAERGDNIIDLPRAVNAFIKAFDAGHLPQYDKHRRAKRAPKPVEETDTR